MQSWGKCLVVAAAFSAGVALAAPPTPQYSADDIIKQFSNGANPDKSDNAAAPPETGCAALGMIAGDDGICEPAKKERGFRLPTKTNPGTSGRAEATTAPSPTPARPAERPIRIVTAKRDLLITFQLGSAVLTEQAQANAKEFATALQSPALADVKFEISGYTDSTGAPARNLVLSQGVDGARILAKGYGASDFAVPNPASPANRRVEAKRVE